MNHSRLYHIQKLIEIFPGTAFVVEGIEKVVHASAIQQNLSFGNYRKGRISVMRLLIGMSREKVGIVTLSQQLFVHIVRRYLSATLAEFGMRMRNNENRFTLHHISP
jgi:hypothetical protein